MSKSKADALAEARARVIELEADAVVGDPDGHFPYRRQDAIDAGVSPEMAELSERVVLADEARRRDPSEENERAYADAVFEAQRAASQRRAVPDSHEEYGVDENGFRVLRRKRDGALPAGRPTNESGE